LAIMCKVSVACWYRVVRRLQSISFCIVVRVSGFEAAILLGVFVSLHSLMGDV